MDIRVAIFIDGSNLYHALRSNFGRYNLNYAKFTNKLCGERRLLRTYYYNVLQDPSQRPDVYREQREFLDILRQTPYLEVRLGSTKIAQGIPVEKGIDVMLATDLLYFAWHDFYDVAILVSGDADFAYALQAVKNVGKHVEVAYFESGVSKDLLDIADKRYLLDQNFFRGLWAGKRPSKRKKAREEPKSKSDSGSQ
ncbi:MAG TPA: NYN domain-containing protein [Dehalococcoidia bacterium]|nr:NYN domain-containing protein [Dehalococcoidia bacterium]